MKQSENHPTVGRILHAFCSPERDGVRWRGALPAIVVRARGCDVNAKVFGDGANDGGLDGLNLMSAPVYDPLTDEQRRELGQHQAVWLEWPAKAAPPVASEPPAEPVPAVAEASQ